MLFYVVVAISAGIFALIGGLIGEVTFGAFSHGAVVGAVGGLGLGAGFVTTHEKQRQAAAPAEPGEDEPPS